MEIDKLIKSLKYVPKIRTALSYPILLLVCVILFFGRNLKNLRINLFLNLVCDFYDHISNFSISLMIYATIGYVGIMFGSTLKHIIITGIVIILFNIIVEFLISFLNTPDKFDAIFGIFGVLFGFAFLVLIKNYGIKRNEL